MALIERLNRLVIIHVLISYFPISTPNFIQDSKHMGLQISEIPQVPRPKITDSFFLEVDLSSCNCKSQIQDCQVGISISTTLMDINCPPDTVYCCNGRKKLNPIASAFLNTTNPPLENEMPQRTDDSYKLPQSEKDSFSVGVADNPSQRGSNYLSQPSPYNEEPPTAPLSSWFATISDAGPSKASTQLMNLTTTISTSFATKQCSCKPREQCAYKHIDYSFGFHCNYNTVRCCEPESDNLVKEPQNNPATSAIQPESPQVPVPTYVANINGYVRTSNDDKKSSSSDYETQPNKNNYNSILQKLQLCYCLTPEECLNYKYNEVSTWRRQDTLCPGELIQCCSTAGGRYTTDTPPNDTDTDDTPEEEDSVPTEENQDTETSDEDEDDTPETSADDDDTSNINRGPLSLSIPIPELKVPVYQKKTEEEPEDVGILKTSTAPPPQLPTFYNYQSPKDYSGYYYPGNQGHDNSQSFQPATEYSTAPVNQEHHNLKSEPKYPPSGVDEEQGSFRPVAIYSPVPVNQRYDNLKSEPKYPPSAVDEEHGNVRPVTIYSPAPVNQWDEKQPAKLFIRVPVIKGRKKLKHDRRYPAAHVSQEDESLPPDTRYSVPKVNQEHGIQPSTRYPITPGNQGYGLQSATRYNSYPGNQGYVVQPATGYPVSPGNQGYAVQPATRYHVSPGNQGYVFQPATRYPVSPGDQGHVVQLASRHHVSPGNQGYGVQPAARYPLPAGNQGYVYKQEFQPATRYPTSQGSSNSPWSREQSKDQPIPGHHRQSPTSNSGQSLLEKLTKIIG